MAPYWRKMAPRWFQEPSREPLRPILERSCPSWRDLGSLRAILGPLGAILDGQEGQKGSGPGGLVAQGQTILPPPRRVRPVPPPIPSTTRAKGKRKEGLEMVEGKRGMMEELAKETRGMMNQ